MNVYWAIAQSSKYPGFCVKRIEAATDDEAFEKARVWHRDDLGFRYNYVVAKEISK